MTLPFSRDDDAYIITTIEPASAVKQSVCARFTASQKLNFIIGRTNRLEVYEFEGEAANMKLQVPINGIITSLCVIPAPAHLTDLLLLTDDQETCVVIKYQPEERKIEIVDTFSLEDRASRSTELGILCTIDTRDFISIIALHIHQGLCRLITIDARNQNPKIWHNSSKRIEELDVLDIKFIYNASGPVLAILHRTVTGTFKVRTYSVTEKGSEREVSKGPHTIEELEYCHTIVPLPSPKGGILLLSDEFIYYNALVDRQYCAIAIKPIRFICHTVLEDGRILLGDSEGNLHVITVSQSNDVDYKISLEFLGTTCIPSCLCYIDSGYLFVGSLFGDSQILQLTCEPLIDNTYIKVVYNLPSSAPISDFFVADLEKQGQNSIIACTGAFREGKISCIRQGIHLHVDAFEEIDFPGLVRILEINVADYILAVLSYNSSSQLLKVNGVDDLEILDDFQGMSIKTNPTFLLHSYGNSIVHVCDSKWGLCSMDESSLFEYFPLYSKTLFASGLDETVVIVNEKDEFVIITSGKVSSGPKRIQAINSVSSIYLLKAESLLFIAVSSWENPGVIQFIDCVTLEIVLSIDTKSSSPIKSIFAQSFDIAQYIFAGTGRGYCQYFQVSISEGKLAHGPLHSLSLGNGPIHFSRMRNGDLYVYGGKLFSVSMNRQRLQFNLTNIEALFVISTGKERTILTITNDGIKICSAEEKSIFHLHHSRTSVAKTLSRITPIEGSLCAALSKDIPVVILESTDRQTQVSTSSLVIIDCNTGFKYDTYNFPSGEMAHALHVSNQIEEETVLVIVGTTLVEGNEEPKEGRIMTFSLSSDHKLQLISQYREEGCICDLKTIGNGLVAAVSGSVCWYRWAKGSNVKEKGWVRKHCHFGQILAIKLDVEEEKGLIAVGDLMRSVSLLKLDSESDVLKEIARDSASVWMTQVSFFDDKTIFGSDNFGNIFVMKATPHPFMAGTNPKCQLQLTSGMHLGETVNRVIRGSLTRQQNVETRQCIMSDSHLLATASGSIYVIASIASREISSMLFTLQSNLDCIIKGIGKSTNEEWRKMIFEKRRVYHSEPQPFIDGDFISKFLELSEEAKAAVAGTNTSIHGIVDTGYSVSQITDIVESILVSFKQ